MGAQRAQGRRRGSRGAHVCVSSLDSDELTRAGSLLVATRPGTPRKGKIGRRVKKVEKGLEAGSLDQMSPQVQGEKGERTSS